MRGAARGEAFDEPCERISNTGLAGFVTPQAGHDAIFDDAANAFDGLFFVAEEKMATRRAHDDHELAGRRDAAGSDAGVGVDVADCNWNSRAQTETIRHHGA